MSGGSTTVFVRRLLCPDYRQVRSNIMDLLRMNRSNIAARKWLRLVALVLHFVARSRALVSLAAYGRRTVCRSGSYHGIRLATTPRCGPSQIVGSRCNGLSRGRRRRSSLTMLELYRNEAEVGLTRITMGRDDDRLERASGDASPPSRMRLRCVGTMSWLRNAAVTLRALGSRSRRTWFLRVSYVDAGREQSM